MRLFRGACLEHCEILHFVQNDRKRRSRNDERVFAMTKRDWRLDKDAKI